MKEKKSTLKEKEPKVFTLKIDKFFQNKTNKQYSCAINKSRAEKISKDMIPVKAVITFREKKVRVKK